MARSSTRSTTVAELRRMFSNLDSSVIESVLAANNDQVDVTIDHLLTMSIDTENQFNIQHVCTYLTLEKYLQIDSQIYFRRHQHHRSDSYPLFPIFMKMILHPVKTFFFCTDYLKIVVLDCRSWP